MDFHDQTIDKIVRRLSKSLKYSSILKNFEYKFSEMDITALRKVRGKNYVLVFEVKTKDTRSHRAKALWQLNKHEVYMDYSTHKVFKFYVYGQNKNQYKIERVK